MAINTAKIEEVIKTEAFAESIKDAQSIEDVQAAFAAKGVELTADEVVAAVTELSGENADELGADDLDAVSGGCRNAGEHLGNRIVEILFGLVGIKTKPCNCGRKW